MKCPKCNAENVYVTNTMTSADNEVLRRRKCSDCDFVFKTVEVVAEETEEFKKKYLAAVEASHPFIKKVNDAKRNSEPKERKKPGPKPKPKVETKEPNQYGFERRVCPFCGESHIGDKCIQTICKCGAKYYPCTMEWLNRETGEIKKGRK